MGAECNVHYGDPAVAISGTSNITDWTDNSYRITWIGDPYYPQAPYVGDPLPPNDQTAPWIPPNTVTYPYTGPIEKSPDIKEEIEKLLKEHLKEEKPKKEENLMKIYEVIVIDAKECEILKKQDVVAKDTETAMLELDLTPEIRKKVKKGEVKFIFNEKGEFTKYERKIKVKELTEED